MDEAVKTVQALRDYYDRNAGWGREPELLAAADALIEQMQPATDEREAFEKWARAEGLASRDLQRSIHGYVWRTEQRMFDAWQARGALSPPSADRELLRQALEVLECVSKTSEEISAWVERKDALQNNIRARLGEKG